jgi:hypothetical protein
MEAMAVVIRCLVPGVNRYSAGWFHVKLCAKCTLHNCYRLFLRDLQNTPTSLLWGSHFQNWWHLAEARNNNNRPGHLKQTFECFSIDWCECEVLSTLHLFSVSFWKCKIFCAHPVYKAARYGKQSSDWVGTMTFSCVLASNAEKVQCAYEKRTIVTNVESGQNDQDCDLWTNITAVKKIIHCNNTECNKSTFQTTTKKISYCDNINL